MANLIKTHQIDPETFNNNRCEFRMRHLKAILSNLRLVDAGYYNTQVTDDTGLYHSRVNGVEDCIQRVQLLSGSTVIDEISKETSEWLMMQNIQGKNTRAQDITRRLLKNGFSWQNTRDGNLTTYVGDAVQNDVDETCPREWFNANSLTDFTSFSAMEQVSASQYEGASGTIDLRKYLGFLQSVPMISDVPDLRLLITWNSGNRAKLQQDVDANTQLANNNDLGIKRPVLLVDEVLGLTEEQMKFKPVSYDRWVSEPLPVPATTDGTRQQVLLRSHAFRDYFVKNLYYMNQVQNARIDASNNQVELLASNRAPAMYRERVQFVVNRQDLLPSNAINNEALKCALADDFIGPRHTPYATYNHNNRDPSYNIVDSLDRWALGNFSVGAVSVNDHISNLDIDYQRTGKLANDRDSAFKFLMFAQCPHNLTKQGGKVRVTH